MRINWLSCWTNWLRRTFRCLWQRQKSSLRDALRQTRLEEKIGAEHFYEAIEDGVQAFLECQEQTPSEQA